MMPVKITENTPEPTDYGLYVAQYDSGEFKFFELRQFALGDGEFTNYWATIDDSDDYSWEEVREELNGGTIQSLAAHDAQIRAEAWDEGWNAGVDDANFGPRPKTSNPYSKEAK